MVEEKKPHTILLVDDDEAFLTLAKEYLKILGYRVTATLSPREALEMAAQGGFDLIISDHKMPNITGLTLLEKIRGKGIMTPFLLVSGWIDSLTEEAVLQRGRAGIVLKPFNLDELEGAVKRALAPG